MSGKYITSSDATFKTEVVESELPVIVDFWAPWCAPCRMVAPSIEELSVEFDGKMRFVKLNTDENPRVAQQYGIMSIPSLLFFYKGKVVDQLVGALPKPTLKQRIERVIAATVSK